MGSVNKVILVGNLGGNPELRYMTNGQAVVNFRLATTDTWGEGAARQERTEWHNIVVFGKQAEICTKYLSKGRQVCVDGEIRSRTYDDKEGNKRHVTEIIAQRVQFLGGGGDKNHGQADLPSSFPLPTDDLPF